MTDDDYDDELLAPPGDVSAGAAESIDDAAVAAEWHPSHGYPDARTSVRIWVDDETRQVTKVRVSPRWREILGPNRSLEQAFAEAFFVASVRVAPALEPDSVVEESTPDPDSTLTWDDLPDLNEELTRLDERFRQLQQRPADEIRWARHDGDKTVAHRGPVSVTLTLEGLAESVRLDRQWLQTAGADQIAAAVLETVRTAYARYQPPEYVPGEFEELALDFARVERDLITIMAKGTE